VIYPGTQLRLVDEHTGYGVFATSSIPAGTVVWVHDELDRVLTPAQVQALPTALQKQVERYAYVNADGNRVLCWDHGRFMNHSCDPTTTSIGTSIEVARRDISPGEQLTCEYGLAYVTEAFECTCGSPNCRKMLQPTDMPEVWRRWERETAEAFALALTVPQPVLDAARRTGPGAWIVEAILEQRHVDLPSWALGVPGGA
jgi:uncharacterized protein